MIPQIVFIVLASIYTIVDGQGSGSGMVCIDMATNCGVNANLCTNRIYEGLMRQQCALTCGVCTTGICKDTNTNCAVWKNNGFCDSPFYDESVKRQYCKAACNINGECNGGSGATG